MKKILITSMVAASMMFVGCGSSSSNGDTSPEVITPENNNTTPENNNTTPENNNTTPENNNTTTTDDIAGTTVIGSVRFANLDDTSIKLSYAAAEQECETFVAVDGSEDWKLPAIDQLLLILSGDDNVINENVIPLFTPDEDKPTETSHTSAIWSGSISINPDDNTSDPDFRDVLFLGSKQIITQNVVETNQTVEYHTICVQE